MNPAKPLTPADDGPRGRPLIVTDSPDLLEDLLRLAAAAGAAVTVMPTARAASRYWASAPLVVVGADRAAACVAADLPPRSDIVLVGTDVDDRRTWSLALLINAEHVIFLPEAETWFVNRLSRAVDAARRRSRIVGVLGGCGGVGSTTLAAALARAGLRHRVRSVLLEIDPFGGLAVHPDAPAPPPSEHDHRHPPDGSVRIGLEEHRPGAVRRRATRRPAPAPRQAGSQPTGGAESRTEHEHEHEHGGESDADHPGRPQPPLLDDDDLLHQLLAGPPMIGSELPVLSWDRDETPVLSPPAVSALFATARGSADLIVVDLPRSTDAAADVGLFLCETVLLVVTTEPAAVAAARRIGAYATRSCADIRVVVRLPRPGDGPARRMGLARSVAAEVAFPLAGVIHHEPAVDPVTMAGPGRQRTTGTERDRPTTNRTSGVSRLDPTQETTAGRRGDTAADHGTPVGQSLIRFSDLFLAELGLGDGVHR